MRGLRDGRALLVLSGLFLLGGCAGTRGVAREPVTSPFFPPPPDPPRLQFLMAISSDADIPGGRKLLTRMLVGDRPLREIVRPRGVAVHGGIIHVADAKLGTVVTIDLQQRTFDWIRDEGAGKLSGPLGLDIAADGTLFVADVARRQVVAFAAGDRHFLRAYGDPGTFQPTDVVVMDDRVYATDARNHDIRVFDRTTGEQVGTLGREGEGPGEFKFPSFLAAGPDRTLYVCDSMNFRIQRISTDGRALASFGKAGDWTGSFTRPKGVAVDENGLVHALDAGFENAQVFLPDGEAATVYGGYGDFPGHMYLPFEIALDRSLLPYFRDRIDPRLEPRYLVLVTNQAGPHKLGIYAFGEPATRGDQAPGP